MSKRHRAAPPVTRRTALAAGTAWTLGALGACTGATGALKDRQSAATTRATAGTRAVTLDAAAAPATAATPTTPVPAETASPTEATTSRTAPPTPTFDAAAHSTTDPASPWVVVNKQHPVTPPAYEPAQVVTVAGELVSAAAAPDLEALLARSRDDGVALTLVSGFRTYAYQEQVHRRSVARQGLQAAEQYSARAGFSEHQTGLAVDFSSADGRATLAPAFADTDEGLWLAAHAAEHGWLLRYTPADQAVTGYSPEPWHFRWVGADLLAAMAARGVATLEEFFGVTGGPDYPG